MPGTCTTQQTRQDHRWNPHPVLSKKWNVYIFSPLTTEKWIRNMQVPSLSKTIVAAKQQPMKRSSLSCSFRLQTVFVPLREFFELNAELGFPRLIHSRPEEESLRARRSADWAEPRAVRRPQPRTWRHFRPRAWPTFTRFFHPPHPVSSVKLLLLTFSLFAHCRIFVLWFGRLVS